MQRLLARLHQHDPLAELSDRDREILALMAEGKTNHGIAEKLVLSERTGESHVRRLLLNSTSPTR